VIFSSIKSSISRIGIEVGLKKMKRRREYVARGLSEHVNLFARLPLPVVIRDLSSMRGGRPNPRDLACPVCAKYIWRRESEALAPIRGRFYPARDASSPIWATMAGHYCDGECVGTGCDTVAIHRMYPQ